MKNFQITSISVVVPVYNEAVNVAPLVAEINLALSNFSHEIIYVDDASTDQTREEVRGLMNQFPQLRMVRHLSNAGQSAAVATGVRCAKHHWIVTLDGDGQNNPADIPKLIQVLQQTMNARQTDKVVVMGKRAKRQDNWLRKVSSRIANQVRQSCLKDNCSDSGCGLKIFPRELFLNLPLFRNCHRFLPALFQRVGAKIISVPVSHRERMRGVSKYGVMNRLWVGIVDLFGVAWLMRRPITVELDDELGKS